uniref:Uncharacterized protein n=1 Tax=Buteo japonicus TaxID=224669 RepID=A0A8B9Z1Z9_9AVES
QSVCFLRNCVVSSNIQATPKPIRGCTNHNLILKVCLFNFRTRKPAWVSTIKVTYVKRATVVDNPSVATTTMNSGVSPSILYGFPS